MLPFELPAHLRQQTHIVLKPEYYPVGEDGTIHVHPHHADFLRQRGFREVAPPPPVLPLPDYQASFSYPVEPTPAQ